MPDIIRMASSDETSFARTTNKSEGLSRLSIEPKRHVGG